MKFLCIGDIYGKPGRETVKKVLPGLLKKHKPDFVLANAENIAHGKGITEATIKEMQSLGVDFFTTGNHVWENKPGVDLLDDLKFPVVRPANYPPGVPGRGSQIVKAKNGKKILIINLMGRVFMPGNLDCPFRAFDAIIEEHKKSKPDVVIVDLHAEATSEKIAFREYASGRATIVFGTHTHVQTSDAQITPSGTAYITDLGMTGPTNSVIGVATDIIVWKFLHQISKKHEIPETGPTEFHGIIVEADNSKATQIEPIRILLS